MAGFTWYISISIEEVIVALFMYTYLSPAFQIMFGQIAYETEQRLILFGTEL